METPYFLMDDLGVKPHYFRKHPIWIWGGKFPQKNRKKKTPEICKEIFGGKIIPWKNNKKRSFGGWPTNRRLEVAVICPDVYLFGWWLIPWLNDIQRPCPFFLPQAKDGINGVLVAEAGFASGRI